MSDRHDRAANPEGSTGCQCHHLADCVTLSAATSHWRPTRVNRPTSMFDTSWTDQLFPSLERWK